MDLNSVVLIGRLTRDAELKTTSSGFAVSNFSIAVNYRKKQGDGWEDVANFFDVTLFGKQAETLHQYLVKGKQVAISGELRQDRWVQDDGQNRSKVVINANSVQLLGNGNSNGGNSNGNSNSNHNSDNGFTPGAAW